MSTDSPSIPRKPSAYRPSIHFGQQFSEPKRHLDGDIVETCITEGNARRDGRAKFLLEADIGGVEYRIVVNVAAGEVVTGHPIAIDEDRARESGRWSPSELADIQQFLEEGKPQG